MNERVLEVKDLSVAFGHHKNGELAAKPVQVTDRVSFHIDDGEFFALVGESGCLRLRWWRAPCCCVGMVVNL